MKPVHWSILDTTRQDALPRLAFCREEGFYLAGGTALALQVGHRDSIDFDFFKEASFDTQQLFVALARSFDPGMVVKVQDERDTLTVLVEDVIKLSFMSYPYPLLRPLISTAYMDLADILDVGCMKLSAITGRAAMKDYVDLYFILRQITLPELLDLCAQKLPQLDRGLILKSLVYFDDVPEEPILYTSSGQVKFDEVQRSLRVQAATAY